MKINKNVLIIDDDAHIRRVLELKLKNAGYQVTTAENGENGMKVINSQVPDAVITDIEMPKMDGKSFIMSANKFKNEHSFLTIIISCSLGFEENEWVDQIDDTHFMEKPFSLNKILFCIDEYFGIKR